MIQQHLTALLNQAVDRILVHIHDTNQRVRVEITDRSSEQIVTDSFHFIY